MLPDLSNVLNPVGVFIFYFFLLLDVCDSFVSHGVIRVHGLAHAGAELLAVGGKPQSFQWT